MKLHKILSHFFLLSCFLFFFIPSVFSQVVDCDDPFNAGQCAAFPLPSPESEPDEPEPTPDEPAAAAGTDSADDDFSFPDRQPADTSTSTGGNQPSGAKDWVKKKLLGDKAKYEAEKQRLQATLRGRQQRCNAIYPHTGHIFTCRATPLPCRKPGEVERICGDKDKLLDFGKLTELQTAADNKIADLAGKLAGKLQMSSDEIMDSNLSQSATTCGKAWDYAKLYCKFPVRAFSGKVGHALNVIGKVAFVGQGAAGLAGKSLNDLCKAITVLSGAGVTISMLAQANCAGAIMRCRKACKREKQRECRNLYRETDNCNLLHKNAINNHCGLATAGAAPPVPANCGSSHMKLDKYQCNINNFNEMKGECNFLTKNAGKMLFDIGQLIATVRSARVCWKETGGDMSPPVSPEVCRQMGGTPYKDEITGDDRCRFREPGENEGVCPPYGMPVSCDQPCPDTGSVPAGCPTGTCNNGQEIVSCTKKCGDDSVPVGCACPDPSLTYPNCDCNCPEGQSCNSDRQCVAVGQSCSSPDDCGDGQICQDGTCVLDPGEPGVPGSPGSGDGCQMDPESCPENTECNFASGQCEPIVCADGSANYPNCGCGNCPTGQLCNPDSGQCISGEEDDDDEDDDDDENEDETCTTSDDCGTGKVCQNGTCVPDGGGETCTTSNDCGPDKICQNGQCFCDCQGSPISCSEQCGGRCLEESVSCPCQGNGECTPPQKCVTSTNGQNVCSDDDGEGVCPDGSRVACDENCPGGSKPANCRSCNGDSDCENDQVCNRGACVMDDPVLEADGSGGGGAPIVGGLGEEDPLAITNDGLGGGDGSDGSNNSGGAGKLPGASSGKQGKGLLARLGALLGIGKGGGAGGFRSGRRSGSQRGDKSAKGGAKDNTAKGGGAGGFGNYGAGGGGARSPAGGGLGLSAAQMKKLEKEKGNKRSAFPKNLGNIGGAHQDIFKAVTRRYQKIYKLK